MSLTRIGSIGINTGIKFSGLTTITTLNTSIDTLSIGGPVSIAGTLTYEDVTNIDSVGLVTARNGIVVGSGITLSKDGDIFATGVTTSTTFVGNLTGDVTGTASGNAVLTGSTNDTLVTVTGANAITGESDLTFDGSTLGVKRSSSGNVAVNIECSSTTAQSRILFTDSSDTDANVSYDHNDRKLYLGTASNSGLNGDLVIDANGKVCIGANDPVHKLSIVGSGTSMGSDATLLSVGNDSFGVDSIRLIGLGYVSPTEDHPPAVIGYQETNGSGSTYGNIIMGTRSVNTNTVASERLRITSGGDVRVGSATSIAGLRYLDVVNTSNAADTHGSLLRLITSNAAATGTTSVDIVKYKDGNFYINNNESSGSTNFYTGGSTSVTIDSSGNLKFDSGFGSVQTAYGVRAWVFINNTSGSMTPYTNGSGGVTSVDDLGPGAGRVNFSITMPNTAFAIVSGHRRSGTYDMTNVGFSNATTSFRFDSFTNGGNSNADLEAYSFVIVR